MMKFLLFLIITSVTILPQDSKIEVLSNSRLIYPYQNGKIQTDEKSFDVFSGTNNIYSEQISGKKVIYTSENGSYLLITNYGFKPAKDDYNVDYFFFDESFKLITKYSEIAPFDLPHPIASVSDNGFFVLFDPLSYELKIIDEKRKTEISLQKEVPLEMERTTFIRCYANTIIVGVNEIAMNNSAAEAEVDLFSIDKSTNKVSASKLNLSILTGLYIDENRIFVSGVVWDNSSVKGKSFIYETSSEKLIQVADFNFDNIVKTDNGYLTSNGNQIRNISSEGIILNETKINSYRIYSLVKHDRNIFLTYSAESGNYLLILNEETLKPQTDPYFISDKQISNKLTISKNNELFIQDINSTFIYRMK